MNLNFRKLILVKVFLLISIHTFSQDYTKQTIKLWDDNVVPFNKENITVEETLDETGMRYAKISEPELYVYRNKTIKKNGAALLFCPGGGYAQVNMRENNGELFAQRFLKMGFNVVAVLKYRLPDTLIVNLQEKVPLCDAQKALSMIHQKATSWSVNHNKIAVIGSSAGGHLAASLANLKDDILAPNVKKKELKQAVSILMYPVISFHLPYVHKNSLKNLLGDKSNNQELLGYYSMENQVSKNTPQTFIIHAIDDVVVPYENSLMYCESLKKYGINYKYVQLEKGGHGFGFNSAKTGLDWTMVLEDWLRTQTNLFNN
jgi:acetyl esterase/lipase